MLHLYEATVSTNMLIVASSRDSAIKTAKIYATDEILEFCDVKLKEIHDESSMSDEWKDLYPYIANKCIDQQKKCHELIKDIQDVRSKKNETNVDERSEINPEKPIAPPDQVIHEGDSSPLKINSPHKKNLPTLRF